jgi:Tfp pilus assembly protein PilF
MHEKIIFRLSCFLLLTAVVLTYLNHFHNSFHFDDSHTIQNNIFIRDIKNIPKFFTDATTFSSNPSNQSYRPVVSATLAVDYWLSGNGEPFFFHLRNFITFLIYTTLTYLFVVKVFNLTDSASNHKYLALFVAALFAFHPLVAETVNYIIARSDIISSMGVMAGMVIWLYFPKKRKYGIYLLPVIFGMLAKPTAAMFAPMLFFTDLLLSKDETKNNSLSRQLGISLRKTLPAFIACAIAYWFIDYMTPKTWIPGGSSRWNYLITQPYVILLYLRNTFLPTHLSADTDLSPFTSLSEPAVLLGFIFLISVVAILILGIKNKKLLPVSLGLFWFLAALVPTSSIIPLAEVMNDHRMFFPLPGLFMALVWLIHIYFGNILKRAGKIIPVLCIVLLASLAYGTHQRNKVWKTEETLWKDVTEKSPRNGRGLMNYGLTLMSQGKIKEALNYFERAKEFTPAYPILFVNIAIAKGALGNAFEAENNFKIALDLSPDNPECNFYYAKFLNQTGRSAQAKAYLQKTLALAPAHLEAKKLLEQVQGYEIGTPEYFLDLSLRLYNEKKFQECIDACHKALQLKPGYAAAYNNICSAYNEMKEYERAMQACDSALKIDPAYTLAKNNYEYARKMSEKN